MGDFPDLPDKTRALDWPPILTELGCYDHPVADLHLRQAVIRDRTVVLQARALVSLRDHVLPAMREARIPLTVVSSYRSCDLQRRLCLEHGCDPATGCPGIVAGVGRSYHNVGLAVDLYPPPSTRIARYRELMWQYGWHNFSGAGGSDPNHWSYQVTG